MELKVITREEWGKLLEQVPHNSLNNGILRGGSLNVVNQAVVLLENEILVAVATLSFLSRADSACSEVPAVYVNPVFRGKGYAKQVFIKALELLKTRNKKVVVEAVTREMVTLYNSLSNEHKNLIEFYDYSSGISCYDF